MNKATDLCPLTRLLNNNIPAGLFASGNHAEDIAQIYNQGFQVDDDNDHFTESIPDPSEPVTLGLKEGQF